MITILAILRFIHIVGAVFMAWPLYALITVNERGRLGPPLGDRTDAYMENIIRSQAVRCYGFQFVLLGSGLGLIWLTGEGLSALVTNGMIMFKFLLLVALAGLLFYVHRSLQPRLDALFARAPGQGPMPQDLGAAIMRLRLRRKRIAAVCLFLVLTAVLLGLQVHARFPAALTAVLLVASALFAWHAYRSRLTYGWV